MKRSGPFFFSFLVAFTFVTNAYAELDFMPQGGGPNFTSTPVPLSSPTGVVTAAPSVVSTPAVATSPTPTSSYPIASPTPSPTLAPSPAPVPSSSPSFQLTLPAAPVLRPFVAPSSSPSPAMVLTPAATPAPTTPTAVATETPSAAVTSTSVILRPKLLPPITLSVFGGGDFISFNEVNQLVGTQLFKSMIYYGGELRYPVSDDFSVLLRAERMSSSSSVGAAAFSLSSLPVMGGIDFHSHHQRKLRFHISVLAGPAFNTQLTETASSLPSPNVTQFSSSAISEMVRLSLEYPISHTIGIFLEGGYRLLKTSSIPPSPTGSGGTVFQSNGQYQPVPLNLSGPFIGGGFVFVL